MLGYAFADNDRNEKDGLNFGLVAGRVIHDAFAVELSVFGTTFDADTGGADADLLGAGLDLALGLPAAGHPVFLLGAGMVQHDVGGQSETQIFGDLGLGYYLPLSIGGELWRLEARYHLLTGEHPALPGEDLVEDLRVNLGVFWAFGREEPPREPEPESRPPPPEPQPEPPVEVVPPVVAPAAPVDTDADDDGVPDDADACPGTAQDAKVDGKGCVVVEDVVLGSAFFGSSSSNLTAIAYLVLRDVAAAMKADPAMRLEIEGHTDMSGPADKNLVLSQARADIVKAFLVELGVDPQRLVAKGYGETRPVNDNKTLEKRAYNRRVQFQRLDR
jgi:outer membrane protein OmpA-like peptidoglycan-associated protein